MKIKERASGEESGLYCLCRGTFVVNSQAAKVARQRLSLAQPRATTLPLAFLLNDDERYLADALR